jgi:hypothetical protein
VVGRERPTQREGGAYLEGPLPPLPFPFLVLFPFPSSSLGSFAFFFLGLSATGSTVEALRLQVAREVEEAEGGGDPAL